MRSILAILHRPLRPLSRVLRDRRGAAAVLLAVALSGIVGVVGLGSEAAAWYYITRSMQGATDAAAASAAAELAAGTSAGSSVSSDQLRNAGRSVAATFNFANGTHSTTVTVNNPPATTTNLTGCSSPFTAFNCYVEVIISQPQTPLLSAVFMSTGPTITSRAVALANTGATPSACVLALNKTAAQAINLSGTGTMAFNGCPLADNSSASNALYVGSNASVTAEAAYVVGGINGTVATTPTPNDTHTGTNPMIDPYASYTPPSKSTCDVNNGIQVNGNGQNSGQMIPPANWTGGTVYKICKGISVGSSTNSAYLSLRPGFTYIVDNGTLSVTSSSWLYQCTPGGLDPKDAGCTAGTATGGGVTIYLTSDSGAPANVDLHGQANVKLSAPTSGPYSGVVIWQALTTCTSANNGNNGNNGGNSQCTNNFDGGATMSTTGALYFPKNAVDFQGGTLTGASCTQLIADTITFSGTSNFNSTCTSAGTKNLSTTQGQLVM